MERTLTIERDGIPRCANCGVEIPWRPAIHHGRTYCCGGCVQGGPCYCSYDLTNLPKPQLRSRESRFDGSPPVPGLRDRAGTGGRHALSEASRTGDDR